MRKSLIELSWDVVLGVFKGVLVYWKSKASWLQWRWMFSV